jgi:hypothetical protein
MRIKTKDIPALRERLIAEQGNVCPLCHGPLIDSNPCLDHDHTDGNVRGVLCGNCNGIEGKVHNLVRRGRRALSKSEYLTHILNYWKRHADTPMPILHPKHRTADEKRLAKNARARKRRAKNKG